MAILGSTHETYRWKLFKTALTALVVLLGPAVHSAAQTKSPSSVSTHPAGPQDPAELAVFLDGLLGGLMEERHIPGAVVLVVKDGSVFFAKGYGFADLETKRPVDPETTLFRVFSVSKLFTATAVMQLVEQGKLDLHADVNQYLDSFSLEERFGKPVTLANLLTHTGGFDDALLGSIQPLEREPVPLGKYLATHCLRVSCHRVTSLATRTTVSRWQATLWSGPQGSLSPST
jgi:CubicO group peptidase (beta-lactamase class C family)